MNKDLKQIPQTGAPVSQDAGTRTPPAWYDEFAYGLSIRSHFVISGNVRDFYPAPRPGKAPFVSFQETLWQLLRSRGIFALLTHDPIDGLRLHDGGVPGVAKALKQAGVTLGSVARTPAELLQLQHRVATLAEIPTALIIDYCSHIWQGRAQGWNYLFISADKAARAPASPRPARFAKSPPRNPTIWIVDRPADLPDWFIVRNDTLREILAEYPNLEDRFAFAQSLAPGFPDAAGMNKTLENRSLEQFALECEGESLAAMKSIAEMAHSEGMSLAQISDVIRMYRTGSRRNPWKSAVLRARMDHAKDILTERVKGQDRAVEKTLDILLRSITGLSGAQTSNRRSRPRGTLFFAGPTGVGKTELAKAVTELLFGDERACHRFDMSEFMEEDSVTRLIGAPPGHPGHDRGGELINALHKRPFSVFLFDEIEKAHPRLLDTFLQILDEGRLTDARGATAHFSEALIIFTSNIGMLGGNRETNMGMTVMPSDPYDQIELKITKAVQDHFRFELKRPEMMNRIGQNIVVFDFINHKSVSVIFDAIIKRVCAAVVAEHGIEVQFSKAALDHLHDLCTHDVFDGGRGVGNRVETHLINPLGREIFSRDYSATLLIKDVRSLDGKTQLVCD